MSNAITRTIGCVLLLVLSLLASTPAAAGGYAFKAEVLDFRALGNDEYRIVFNDLEATDLLIIHLRHDEVATRDVSKDLVSKEKYLAAIELLKQRIAQSPIIQLGIMGGRPAPIDDTGEVHSYSLSVVEGIIYSWHGAID
jgi:hypothetical protein